MLLKILGMTLAKAKQYNQMNGQLQNLKRHLTNGACKNHRKHLTNGMFHLQFLPSLPKQMIHGQTFSRTSQKLQMNGMLNHKIKQITNGMLPMINLSKILVKLMHGQIYSQIQIKEVVGMLIQRHHQILAEVILG